MHHEYIFYVPTRGVPRTQPCGCSWPVAYLVHRLAASCDLLPATVLLTARAILHSVLPVLYNYCSRSFTFLSRLFYYIKSMAFLITTWGHLFTSLVRGSIVIGKKSHYGVLQKYTFWASRGPKNLFLHFRRSVCLLAR